MLIYRFRNCLLNTVERSVIKGDQYVELTTKTFDVLLYLIENAGNIVTKDDLLGAVWNGNFVEESNLPVHISKLRRSLGQGRGERYIETVQGVGYRFVAAVNAVQYEQWNKAVEDRVRLDTSEFADSIAVLPLLNENSDPSVEYLVDGLTERLINRLSNFANLKVIARTTVFRYKNRNLSPMEIGGALGVSAVFVGRVRIVDGEVTVTAELVRTRDSVHIWGGTHRRSAAELPLLEEEVSLAVAKGLTSERFQRRRSYTKTLTRNPESYRLYLKGRYFLERHSREDMYAAIDFFRRSITLDPDNVHSYTEIVECYQMLYTYDYMSYEEFRKNIEPIVAALSTREQSVDVVEVMYSDLMLMEWRFDEARRYCRMALILNPNSVKARLRYSHLLMLSRDFAGALDQLEQLLFVDPLSPLLYKRLGRLFYLMGEFQTAVAYLNDALDLEPNGYETLALRGATYLEIGEYEAALRDFKESGRVEDQGEMEAMIGVVYARQGQETRAKDLLRKFDGKYKKHPAKSTLLALIHLALGESEMALDCLERAFVKHEPDMRALTYDRRWAPIRRHPRFKALVKRVGLPELGD